MHHARTVIQGDRGGGGAAAGHLLYDTADICFAAMLLQVDTFVLADE